MSDDAEAAGAEEAELAEQILKNQQWPRVVKLRYPVEFGRQTITELEFRRGKLGDLKGLGFSPGARPTTDQLLMCASRLCSQPSKVMESLDPDDASEVLTEALLFFARCQGAGRTP